MACGTQLRTLDLIPIVSYLLLGGHCRYCGSKFSIRYLFIEFLTCINFFYLYITISFLAELLSAILLSLYLIVIAFIDIDHQLILDKVLIWLAGTGVVINLFFEFIGITDMISAALLGSGIMLIIAVASRGGMGGGDIKFVAALGLWLGWKLTLLTLFLAFVLGGIGGAIVLLLKIKGRKDSIPFGPFIALGAYISMLYGSKIIDWYMTKFL